MQLIMDYVIQVLNTTYLQYELTMTFLVAMTIGRTPQYMFFHQATNLISWAIKKQPIVFIYLAK